MPSPYFHNSPGLFVYPQGIPALSPRPPFIATAPLSTVPPPAPPNIPHPVQNNDPHPLPHRHSSPSDHEEAATAGRFGRGMRGSGRQTRGRGRANRGAIKRKIGLQSQSTLSYLT